MVMGGRVNEANDLATLKAAIANVSFGLGTKQLLGPSIPVFTIVTPFRNNIKHQQLQKSMNFN